MLKAGGCCSFNVGDLGIALGSAVSRAADMRVDNRIMYSVGKAVLELDLLGAEVHIAYGIPLSVSGKSHSLCNRLLGLLKNYAILFVFA